MQIKDAGVSLAFVPEDRLGMGLVGDMGMVGNMMLRSWRQGKGAFVSWKEPSELARQVMDELEVATPSVVFPVRRLSGGNVQKVLVGREIASAPSVLMSAYAVRGLDINTSYTIYNLMTEQKKKGVAVLFVGEDQDVLLELCDRILVLCDGKVSGVVDARATTKEEIGLLMTSVGGQKGEKTDA
jgi:simple sugar transport system ATP-binding protein